MLLSTGLDVSHLPVYRPTDLLDLDQGTAASPFGYFCSTNAYTLRFWRWWVSAVLWWATLPSPCHVALPTSLVAQMVKTLPAIPETQVRSLGWEDLLEKEMATHSSIPAWRIPGTEEPGRLRSMGSQRVGHDWTTSLHFTSPSFASQPPLSPGLTWFLGGTGFILVSFCLTLPLGKILPRKLSPGTSLAIQWLRLCALSAEGVRLILVWGPRIPQAWHVQKQINKIMSCLPLEIRFHHQLRYVDQRVKAQLSYHCQLNFFVFKKMSPFLVHVDFYKCALRGVVWGMWIWNLP